MDEFSTIKRASDIATDVIDTFKIEALEGGRMVTLSLYPFTAGKLIRCASSIRKMHLSTDKLNGDNPLEELLRVTEECSDDVAEVIAIATLRTKEEVDTKLEERKTLILWSPTVTQQVLMQLFLIVCTRGMCEDFMKAIRWAKTLPEMITPTAAKRMAQKPTGDVVSGDSQPQYSQTEFADGKI